MSLSVCQNRAEGTHSSAGCNDDKQSVSRTRSSRTTNARTHLVLTPTTTTGRKIYYADYGQHWHQFQQQHWCDDTCKLISVVYIYYDAFIKQNERPGPTGTNWSRAVAAAAGADLWTRGGYDGRRHKFFDFSHGLRLSHVYVLRK